jgi:uncharacterized protein
MATLYVASTETYVGKSAVCAGLLDRMRRDGFQIGYMKPVSVALANTSGAESDDDAAFICRSFGLTEPLEQVAPVLITPGAVEALLRGQPTSHARRLRDAYLAVSRGKDMLVLEGANSWAEGALVDLTADQVTELLDAPGLLVSRYSSTLNIDAILAVQRYVGDRLLGVLLNQVKEPQIDFVRSRVIPFLEARNIPVFGLLPYDEDLAGVRVHELRAHLGGQFIGDASWGERVIYSLMIGAMGAEASRSFFRRRSNKAVITGGDRADLQLAALETSTSVLVLTGNIYPTDQVLDRAEACGVPIILVPDETLTTVDQAEMLFGRVRFHQPSRLSRFTELMDAHFDYQRLYRAIGLSAGS